MIEGIPKISVIVICYKQEELIKRAINSLLAQKDYIYEICVSDDCSPDRTWEVLQEYDKQYPGLFKLHQNRPNVGIFENIEYTWTMPTGDIIYRLAGDDECGEGWFKTVIEFIQNNHIDYKNELFCIYANHQCRYPNGDSITIKNKYVNRGFNRVRLYERGLLYNRGCTYSIKVLNKFHKVSIGRSYVVENAQDSQVHIFSEIPYYIDKIANIYYSSIGVSSSINSGRVKEYENTMIYAFDFFKSIGLSFPNSDKNLPQFNIAQKHFRWSPSLNNYCLLVIAYFKSFDFPLSFYGFDLKRKIFALLRRLPHTKSVNW